VPCQSCARLPINFSSLEEFLARLSKAARKDLRRKCAPSKSQSDSKPHYFSFSGRGSTSFISKQWRGVHWRLARTTVYFLKESVRESRAPSTRSILCRKNSPLSTFFVAKQEAMVDKYFCMDYELGRKYNLYVLSWLENVAPAWSEKSLSITRRGYGEDQAHLGATFIPESFFYSSTASR